MLPEISDTWVWAVGLASLLAVLLLFLLRPRRAIAGRALTVLEGTVAGPGARGARVHPPLGARASSFFLDVHPRIVPVLARDATIVSSLLAGHRGELRVGDRIQVQGIWKSIPRAENLYRQLGCEQAIDALCLVRGFRWRALLRGVALAACLSGTGVLGGFLLLHLGETLEVEIPVLALAPTRALLRGSLECPEGTAARIAPVRDPRAPGWIRWCELPTGKPHGPWRRHDLFGEVAAEGERHLGLRHGRWITRSRQDPFLTICDYDRDERHGYYLERGYGYRKEGWHQRGLQHGRWDRWEAPSGSSRQLLVWSRGFDRGIPEGFWIEPGTQGHYHRGNRHGRWAIEGEAPPEILAYHYDQRLTLHVVYRDGVREGPAAWLDGRVVARGSYHKGKPSGQWVRFGDSLRDDGVLEEQSYRDGERHGPARVFAPDGTIAAEGEHSAGKREGRWKIWTLGQLWTGDYQRGRRVGRWRVYRIATHGPRQRTLRLREEGSYRDGVRHGPWRMLDADGRWAENAYVAGRLTGREGDQQLRLAAHLVLVSYPRLGLPTIDLDDHR